MYKKIISNQICQVGILLKTDNEAKLYKIEAAKMIQVEIKAGTIQNV